MVLKFFNNKSKEATSCVCPIEQIKLPSPNKVSKAKNVVAEWQIGHPSEIISYGERISAKKRLHLVIRAPSENAMCVVLVEV